MTRSIGEKIKLTIKNLLKNNDDIDFALRNLNRINISQSGENFVQVKKDLQKTMQMNFGDQHFPTESCPVVRGV